MNTWMLVYLSGVLVSAVIIALVTIRRGKLSGGDLIPLIMWASLSWVLPLITAITMLSAALESVVIWERNRK